MFLVGVNMQNKKNLGLILGLVLSLYTIYPAYAQEDTVIEQESSQEISEIKVDKETPEKVLELINKKDYEAALPLLNAYIAAKPKKYQGYKLRGEVYYALRRYDLAVQDFQKAVDIKTDNDKLATGTKVLSAVVLGADKQEQYQNPELGVLYAQLMYAQKAVNNNLYEVSYKKALEYNSHQYLPTPKKEDISKINCPQKYGKTFNPKGVDAEIASIIEDIEKGHFSEAAYKLPKLTAEYPNYYLGQYLTGVVMHGMEQEQEAVTAFNNALKLNPNDFESYASLGLLYDEEAAKTFNKEYAQKSIDNFKKAITLNPNCHTYYFYLGLNQIELGNYDIAVENFKKALSIKNNDYNSMYYKSIAQYLQKDYYGTISETTNMLYRRVSNYNSVLYLRALAYYKLKNEEAAFADIEKIHQNLNDIYNIDIKPLTPKEQVLNCYLHYLQSRITRDNGMGAKSDLQKAYKNPVIALLDTRKNDFEHANFKLTNSDIENQYEYLVTTFDDLGVDFEFLNPDYKIITKKQNIPSETPEKIAVNTQEPQTVQEEVPNEKLQQEEIEPQETETVTTEPEITQQVAESEKEATVAEETPIVSEEKTPKEETQPEPKEISQVKEIVVEENKEIITEVLEDKVEEIILPEREIEQVLKSEETQEKPLQENTENSPVTVYDPYTLIFASDNEQKEEVPVSDKKENTEEISDLEKANTENSEIQKPEPQEIPESSAKPEETEKSEVSKVEQTENVPQIRQAEQIQDVEDTVTTEIKEEPATENIPAENKKTQAPVKEKYAKVNLAEFEVKTKKLPEFKEEDEVIFLEPDSLFKKQEQKVQESLNNLSLVPATNVQPKDEKLALPSSPAKDAEKLVDINITKESDSLTPQKETVEPQQDIALIEPEEINLPQKTKDKVSEIAEPNTEESHEVPTIREFSNDDLSEKFVNNIETKDKSKEEELSETTVQDTQASENIETEVDETLAEISEQEIAPEKPEKKKKTKKSKQKDNLIIAVGGDMEDYAAPPEKKAKVKKEKSKKKVKKEKEVIETPSEVEEILTEQQPEIVETKQEETPAATETIKEEVSEITPEPEIIQPVEEQTEEVAPVPSIKEETKLEELETPATEETVATEEATADAEKSAEVEPDVNVEPNTEVKQVEENVEENNNPEIQKPKKISFWKRIFSRKKPAQVSEVEVNQAPVPEIETEEE